MSEPSRRKISFPKGSMVEDVTLRIKLILRLMTDGRVPIYLKALPLVSLLYLVFPDLIFGPVDDVAVIWLGAFLFVELCPSEIVQEHVKALRNVVPGAWRDTSVAQVPRYDQITGENASGQPVEESSKEDGSIVDVEFWDKKDL